ncbi:MAG: two-component regulator propeller domain-containing protein, partial [Pseudomonadota bacterium]
MNIHRSPCNWAVPLALLLLGAPAYALDQTRLTSQWIERHWNARNGMPSETVWEVHQSDDGYLWIATDIGLVRFDGSDFDLFNSEREAAFRSNDVRSLAEASDGTLWVATYGGGVVRRRNGRFRHFGEDQGLVSPVVLNARVDQDDTLWAGTAAGVCRLRPQDSRFRCWTPADGVAQGRSGRIAAGENGEVWVGSIDGGLNLFRGSQVATFGTADGLDSPQVFLTERDAELGVVVGTYTGGLYTV